MSQLVLIAAFGKKLDLISDAQFKKIITSGSQEHLAEFMLQQHIQMLTSLSREKLLACDGDMWTALRSVGAVGLVEESGVSLETIASQTISFQKNPVDSNESAIESTRQFGPNDAETETPALNVAADSSRFERIRLHARGGLGEVLLAFDRQLNREVALKEIQSEFADQKQSRARFLQEAEITGRLEHPGIVPVYAMGQYADGRPYYAMRFIRGESLKQRCDRFHSVNSQAAAVETIGAAGSSTAVSDPNVVPSQGPASINDLSRDATSSNAIDFRKILGHFLDTCNAIEYAHSRGVIHRDLKPSNLLIGKYGETLVVDWGLAKFIGMTSKRSEVDDEVTLRPQANSSADATQMGQVIGTPSYMSPEQAGGNHDQLDQRSDVYSLGATLYYILTGQAPVKGQNPQATLTRVQAGDFQPPRLLQKKTPRGLDAICLRAMALEPQDRYSSVRELGDEVDRWLAGEPVVAYREPIWSSMMRSAKRYRVLVAAASAATVVSIIGLLVFLVVVSAQNTRLHDANEMKDVARQRALGLQKQAEIAATKATRQAARSDQLADLLLGMFKANDPLGVEDWELGFSETERLSLSARDILDRGLESIRSDQRDPFVDASLLSAIGETYVSIGEVEKGRDILREALRLARPLELEGKDRAILANSLTYLGWVLHETAQYTEAEALLLEAQVVRKSYLDLETPEGQLAIADGQFRLGWLYSQSGSYATAEELLRKVIEVRERIHGKKHRQVAFAYSLLGATQFQQNHDSATILATIMKAQAAFGDSDKDKYMSKTIQTYQFGLLAKQGSNYTMAAGLFKQAIEHGEKAVGPKHPFLAFGYHELARCQLAAGNYEAADQAQTKTRELVEPHISMPNTRLAAILILHAEILEARKKYDEARKIYLECVDACSASVKDGSAPSAVVHQLSDHYYSLGKLSLEVKQYGDAEQFANKMVEVEETFCARHDRDREAREELASTYSAQSYLFEEIHLPHKALRATMDELKLRTELERESPDNRTVVQDLWQTHDSLIEINKSLGRVDTALEHWSAMNSLLTKFSSMKGVKPNDRRSLGYSHINKARFLRLLGNYDRAGHHLDSARHVFESVNEEEANHDSAGLLSDSLGQLAFDTEDYETAVSHFEQALMHYEKSETNKKSKRTQDTILRISRQRNRCNNLLNDPGYIPDASEPDEIYSVLKHRLRQLGKSGDWTSAEDLIKNTDNLKLTPIKLQSRIVTLSGQFACGLASRVASPSSYDKITTQFTETDHATMTAVVDQIYLALETIRTLGGFVLDDLLDSDFLWLARLDSRYAKLVDEMRSDRPTPDSPQAQNES